MTDTSEQAPVDTTPLRKRIATMDSAARDACFAGWTFPDLADETGAPVLLPADTHGAIEQHIARHEPLAPGLLPGLAARYTAMPHGPQRVVALRLEYQGIDLPDFADPATFTLGRAMTIEETLNDVDEIAAAEMVAAAFDTTVADAVELDWARFTVTEALAAVAAHPHRVGEGLAAEQARETPRKGVVDKLVPLARQGVSPASVAGPAAEPSDGGWASARPPMPAPSDPPPTTAVADPPLAAAPTGDPWPPLKFAAILGRLGSEMVAVSRQIEAHWTAATAGTTSTTVDL